ncbi:hypothetical protein R1sor_003224 [Riccia sorocarpa]|uniref:Uncharacterized protein n=1 Tax=Riccia sorocarpa TaxID=122646 RepID=A0ABD3H0Z3_9MARC
MAAPRSLSEINDLIAGGLGFPKTRLAVTVPQFSSNEQLHYVYRACAFRRGDRGERMCWKSVERLAEKASFLEKRSKEVAGDWEVCIDARPKDMFRDAKVTYFSHFLNCLDNLPTVYEVEQKFAEQVKVSGSAIDTHVLGTTARAVRALQECRLKVDSSIGQFNHICEQTSSVQTEIEEVKSVLDETAGAVEDILSLVESQG